MRLCQVTLLFLMVAGPLSALTPLPPCTWDVAGRSLNVEQEAAGIYNPFAYPTEVGDGFASSTVDGGEEHEWGDQAMILQHCPTGDELLILLPEGNTQRFSEVYNAMVYGSDPHTMREIGVTMGQMGAGVVTAQNEFGECACSWLYPEGF